MNYPLLITVCSLAAGMIGMERCCSWRMNVMQQCRRADQALPQKPKAEVSTPMDAQQSLSEASEMPVRA